MRTSLVALAGSATVVSVTLFACGGEHGSSGTTETSTLRTEADFCESRRAAKAACEGDAGVPPSYVTECKGHFRCVSALLEPARWDAFAACATQTDCAATTSIKPCTARAGVGGPAAEADACTRRIAECRASTSGKSFDDEICARLPAFTSAARTRLARCVDEPCATLQDCFTATVKLIAPDCQ